MFRQLFQTMCVADDKLLYAVVKAILDLKENISFVPVRQQFLAEKGRSLCQILFDWSLTSCKL